MNTKRILAITILFISSFSITIIAKEEATKNNNILNPEERPSYLDQFKNQDVCKKLRIFNPEYIYFL